MNIQTAAEKAWSEVEKIAPAIGEIAEKNVCRVLDAFRVEKIGAHFFSSSSGYGYDDLGRDRLESLYARVFSTEAALIRQQIISGTHAISLVLFGNLLPGDELLSVGLPYDTLQNVIGVSNPGPGTLRELGVTFRLADIDFDAPDPEKIANAIGKRTKMVAIQRSRGYAWRSSLSVAEIGEIIKACKAKKPEVIVFVDNCYGEMVEDQEPSHAGADICAGSLIKNMGAGLVPGGGYIVGREDLVERAAFRLSVPGAGREVGPSLISNRLFYQSLFMAPQIVKEAVLGSIFSSWLLSGLGFQISPGLGETRHDIILAVKMKNSQQLIAFCQGIQKYSPIDSYLKPCPATMPGYADEIIMAAGAFVQGSTIELSADAPLREPYILYLQGGLNRYHVKYALIRTLEDMRYANLL